MTLGLLGAGPLQMLFSLLMMQGLSLTMWRTFLQQAIPRFDPMRFSVNIGNEPKSSSTTPAPNLDAQNLLPYLNILAPILMQQHMQRQQTVQQMHSLLLPNSQPSTQPIMSAPIMSAPIMAAPAYQTYHNIPYNGQHMPQVIIVPQAIPQQSSKGSASNNFAVQVEPPQKEQEEEEEYATPSHITRRMLERPPKTTTRPTIRPTTKTTIRPKVMSRAHAGAIHVQFVTPKAPAGFRRYIIAPVTARIVETEVSSTESYDQISSEPHYVSSHSADSLTKSDLSFNIDTTTPSQIENIVDTNNRFDSILTTTSTPVTIASVDTTSVPSIPITSTEEESDKENVFDKNLLNHRMNDTKDKKNDSNSVKDFIHSEFVEHVKNVSLKQIDSNQSSHIYFENSKGVGLNDTNSYQLTNNTI